MDVCSHHLVSVKVVYTSLVAVSLLGSYVVSVVETRTANKSVKWAKIVKCTNLQRYDHEAHELIVFVMQC